MKLHEDHPQSPSAALVGTALAIAPAAIGCAAGLLLAERVPGRVARQGLAFGLITLGALAAAPLVLDSVSRTMDHPAFRRGRQRRLAQIRDSGAFLDMEGEDAKLLGGEEYFDTFQLNYTNYWGFGDGHLLAAPKDKYETIGFRCAKPA